MKLTDRYYIYVAKLRIIFSVISTIENEFTWLRFLLAVNGFCYSIRINDKKKMCVCMCVCACVNARVW